jgi:hypothetical protein
LEELLPISVSSAWTSTHVSFQLVNLTSVIYNTFELQGGRSAAQPPGTKAFGLAESGRLLLRPCTLVRSIRVLTRRVIPDVTRNDQFPRRMSRHRMNDSNGAVATTTTSNIAVIANFVAATTVITIQRLLRY